MHRARFVVVLLAGSASLAAAQEIDRGREPHERRWSEAAPVDSARPVGPPARWVPEFLPEEGVDPDALPRPEPIPPPEPPAEPSTPWVELEFEGRLRLGLGHDSNVFRADRSAKGDTTSRASGELELTAEFFFGGELFNEVSGDSLSYVEHARANEHFVSHFVEYFQPLAEWFDVGAQNALELSRLNLLNDNGDLVPRGRFGSLDEEARLFAILRVPGDADDAEELWWEKLALELGASFRDKNYEENPGVESLDYTELRFDAAATYRVSRRPRVRFKIKYRFRRRDYREFRARDRDGSAFSGEEPRLELQRHQVNLTWFQHFRRGGLDLRLVGGLGGTYNRDLYANDRSYRELSASFRAEWWVVPERTSLSVALRALGRDFLVRPLARGGGRLRHRLLRVSVGAQQVLGDFPPRREGGRPIPFRARLALYLRGTSIVWRSADAGEDYDRVLVEGGIEATW